MSDPLQLTFQEAFKLYQKHSDSLNQLWQFYSTVALALLSGVIASEKIKATRQSIFVFVGGFVIFSLANLSVIFTTHSELIQLANAVNALAKLPDIPTEVKLYPVKQWQLVLFHLFADTAFSVAMISIYRSSQKQKDADNTC